MERGLLSRILFPVLPPSYSVDSFPHDLVWVPRGKASTTLLELAKTHPSQEEKDVAISSWREETFHEELPAEDHVPCLLLTYPSARFLIIFFHSNAEDLGRCHGFCSYLREQFQVHVLAVEYPGYGICPGVPTGESVMANAYAALYFSMRTLGWPLDSIKIFGRSIGTGPAIGLASLFSFAGLILVTPFLSIQELFRDRLGVLAALVEEWFANKDLVPKITSPTMIIHGQRDELIACRHGEVLYDLLTSRKLLVSPPDMEHNTNLLTNLQFFVLPMFQFFALPDYTFQEMQVPEWAYDKRRSPFYVRPQVEISSSKVPPAQGDKQSLAVPRGDNGEQPHHQINGASASGSQTSRVPKDDVGFQVDIKPETKVAIQRLEEFAGKLCTQEICSDKLCEVEQDQRPVDPKLQKQEEELHRLVRSRSRPQASPGEPPVAPRLLAQRFRNGGRQPGSGEEQSRSLWVRWCTRGIVEEDEDEHSASPRRQYADDSPHRVCSSGGKQPPASASTASPRRSLEEIQAWKRRTGGMTEEDHVRARWARRSAAQRAVGRPDAPGMPPPMGGPDDLPGSSPVTRMSPTLQTESQWHHRGPAWTACCHAVPSDPAGTIGACATKRVVGIPDHLDDALDPPRHATWGGVVLPPRGTVAADVLEEPAKPVFCSMMPWRVW